MENTKPTAATEKTALSKNDSATAEQKKPDREKFRKFLVDDKEENQQATLPSPFQMIADDVQTVAPEIKIDNSLQLELVDKMVEKMVFQVENGIEETTLYLGDESVFSGTEITLTYYDTAPDSFHIAMACEPHIVETIAEHLPQLKKRLEKNVPSYRIRMGAPRIKALKN